MAQADETLAVPHTATPTRAEGGGDTAALATARVFAGRYVIEGLLGTGGMGAVYRVRDQVLDEVVALKLIRPEHGGDGAALARFKQEVRLARRVTHPNVVRTFDLGEAEGTWYLTMEYVAGQSLRRRLSEGPPLAPQDILRISEGIARGLQAAHDAGVVHRDLKPDNVMIGQDDRVLLTDFGIARARAAESSHETLAGVVGTPAYMAPEQVDGQSPIGPPADLYAFGAVLFEMVCGRRLWEGNNPLVVAAARLLRPPDDPRTLRPELPEAISAILLRCLARDPLARPTRVLDAWESLRDAAATMGSAPARSEALPAPSSSMPSLVMLPLRASDSNDSAIATGLSEEIVDALSMTRGLRVRPLAEPPADGEDGRSAGRRLSVQLVLEGALRRQGERLRLTMRLLGVEDGFQLWAQRFEGGTSDLFTMADDVARAVASSAGSSATAIAQDRRGATDGDAVVAYLAGRDALRRGWFANPEDGLALLESAHRHAPDDATILAWLSIARSRCAFWNRRGDFDQQLFAARKEAERALQLSPRLAEARIAAVSIHLEQLEYPEVARHVRQLLLDSPGVPRVQQMAGALLLELGRLPEALRHLRAASTLDPTSDVPLWELARLHAFAGRWDEVDSVLGRESLNTDSKPLTYATQCRLAMWRRDRTLLPPPKVVDVSPLPSWGPALGGLQMHAALSAGRLDGPLGEAFRRPIPKLAPRYLAILRQLRCEILVTMGDEDAALVELEGAVAAGLCDVAWFERCPLLDGLRLRDASKPFLAAVRARAEAVARAFDGER